jgi:hypothetical protein
MSFDFQIYFKSYFFIDNYCCYPFLGSHKNEKIQKKYIKRNPKNNRSEKRIAGMLKKCQNWLRFKNAKG